MDPRELYESWFLKNKFYYGIPEKDYANYA
jgi:hypothetical protein